MDLNPKQQAQVDMQLQKHTHDSYTVDIELAPDHILKEFSVHKDVFRPDITSAKYLSTWLLKNSDEYADALVIDMGCGTGIQGIVTALYGASHAILADVSLESVANAQKNIDAYQLADKAEAIESDLFEGIFDEAKLIVFNHPFFSANYYEEIPISRSMLGGEVLIHKFLEAAPEYLRSDGKIIMPYLLLASDGNNPLIQGPKHGYNVSQRFSVNIEDGIQHGPYFIYELKKQS